MATTHPQRVNNRLVRSPDDRVFAGVAAALARRFRLDPVLVRAAFVVTSLAGGTGAILYAMAWASMPEGTPEPASPKLPGARQVVAVGCLGAGVLLLARTIGLWPGDALVWPVAAVTLGSMFVWVRTGDADRRWFRARSTKDARFRTRAVSFLRMATGFALVIGGTFAVLKTYSPVSIGNVLAPIAIAITGLLLALGPWLLRLSRQVSQERRDRIRSEERSALAAHLHDSVLQTLALIQRSPDDATTLARQQERELRAWLYGAPQIAEETTLRSALEAMAARAETAHRIPMETVVVGDLAMDERTRALVQAAGEAMHNAGRHSGARSVAVYAEVTDAAVTAYVRDEGKGFDVDMVPPDRRGIADSIRGRVARFGGVAEVQSAIGAGTEVKITVPRQSP